jgi:hypothetical protein
VNKQEIIAALDAELARLQQARSLIAQLTPPASGMRKSESESVVELAKRRVLSPEARKKMAAAQRRRWAQQKNARKVTPTKKKFVKTFRKPQVSAQAAKDTNWTVQVTKLPAKTRSERAPRSPKKAAAAHALSSRAEVVAVNTPGSQV